MMRRSDLALPGWSEPIPAPAEMPEMPAVSAVQDQSALEALLYPVVIIKQRSSICFMNDAARRLLTEGLDRRLAAHIHDNPDMAAMTQVHFKRQNGHDLVLQVRLGEIEWRGEKAMQVSLSDVTPYLAMIQGMVRKLETQKGALEELAARRSEAEQQLGAHSEALAKLRAELEAESAARTKMPEAADLRKDLDLVTQENALLRSDVTALVRVREELKESRLRLQKQIEELQAAAGLLQGADTAQAQLEERARSLAAELEASRAELKLETRKSAEAGRTWENERAGFSSRADELAASLEQARRQANEEAQQRLQAQAELEKARAATSASEEADSKLREELEALRRDREQFDARGQEESSQVTQLLEKNARLNQDLADRVARESELTSARGALEQKAEALARELAAAQAQLQEHQGAEAGELAKARGQLEGGAEDRQKLSAQIEKLQSELSTATAQREELQRKVVEQLSGNASVSDEIKAEIAKRQSLEKEIAALRQELATSKLTRPQSATALRPPEGQGQDYGAELARMRKELAAANRLLHAQKDLSAQAEGEASSLCSRPEGPEIRIGQEDQGAGNRSRLTGLPTGTGEVRSGRDDSDTGRERAGRLRDAGSHSRRTGRGRPARQSSEGKSRPGGSGSRRTGTRTAASEIRSGRDD